jgi:BMFP domain-containing protein YqiC
MALPFLDAMLPRAARAGTTTTAKPPRRMLAVCTGLGLVPDNFFPTGAGREYAPSLYLQHVKEFRNDFTVFTGMSHPEVGGGHAAEICYLTGAHNAGSPSFRNSISLDQFAAERLGPQTRFNSLSLGTYYNYSLSVTRTGATLPAEISPSKVFAQLFLNGSPQQVRQQMSRLEDGRSILDAVAAEAKSVQRPLGTRDREKLDEFFSSVRDLEKQLVSSQDWAKKPKPKVNVPAPQDIPDPADAIGRTRLLYDLVHLALQTDSTRLITCFVHPSGLVLPIGGVTGNWHDLSHHGKDPEKLRQLALIEQEEFKALNYLLGKLKSTREGDETLLDRTMVLFGSNLGNASTHRTDNLPMLLAGGGFRHGGHMVFEPEKNTPLCNLYVTMLQRLGVEAASFGSSTGTLTGLEAT